MTRVGGSVESLFVDVASSIDGTNDRSTEASPTPTGSPSPFSGTITMPDTGMVNGYSSYWSGSNAERTATGFMVSQPCVNPSIAIQQHTSTGDGSIHGSYYITDASGNTLVFDSFKTHSGCQYGGWCTHTQFTITLEVNTQYFLAFQNGDSENDMCCPSVFPDNNTRTVGIATFSDPRLDNPVSEGRGLPSSSASWQNRWQVICQ